MGSYGLPLFGLLIPWPPPYVLWALIGLDIALTFVPSVRRRRWPLAPLVPLSVYLAIAGAFSPVFFILLALGIIQTGLLLTARRAAPRSRS